MSINRRIKELRKSLGLNQSDFGARIGLKNSAISKLEQDGNTVVDQNKRIICDKFGASLQWLETGEGEMYAENDSVLLSQVAEHYKLSSEQQALVQSFLDLTADQRDAVVYSVCQAADAIRQARSKEQSDMKYKTIHDFLESQGIYVSRTNHSSVRNNVNAIFLSLTPFPNDNDNDNDMRSDHLFSEASYLNVAREVTEIMNAADGEKDNLIEKFKSKYLARQYAMQNDTTYISPTGFCNVPDKTAAKLAEQIIKRYAPSDREQAHAQLDQELDAKEQVASASPSIASEKQA